MPAPAAKTRADAWELLTRHTKNPNLIKHALAVEAAMRHYARHFNQDEELWGMVGLLHDFDYEQYPSRDDHPYQGQKLLEEASFLPEVLRAIMAHAPHTGTTRDTTLEKAIFAVDELAGFLVAVALTRPTKKLAEVEVSSVKKKMKQAGFARGVQREDIIQGAAELGVTLEEHIQHVLAALQGISPGLGL